MIRARCLLIAVLSFGSLWPLAPVRAEDSTLTLAFGGRERSYALHVPPAAAAKHDLALVVVLHGGGGSGSGAAKQSGFNAEADRQGFIAAYPDGTRRPGSPFDASGRPGLFTWNAGACCGFAMEKRVDDVGFVRALVAAIAGAHAIDRHRVYATGLSNGGMMSYRLACEAGDIFAAIGVVAGVVVTPCTPAVPVSVLHIHGSADENVPIAGGVGRKAFTRTNYPPVAESIALWRRVDGCAAAPLQTQPLPAVSESDYPGCRAGTAVVFDLIAGGGHSWPGGERMALFLDPPSTAMAATPAIWRFFAAHPKQ